MADYALFAVLGSVAANTLGNIDMFMVANSLHKVLWLVRVKTLPV